MLDQQLPAIVVTTPLFTALLVTVASLWRRVLAYPLAIFGLGAAVVATVLLFYKVTQTDGHRIVYFVGGWNSGIPIGIHLVVDTLNGIVLMVISTVALLAAIYSLSDIPRDAPEKAPQFYVLFLLLVTGLLGMTITGDAFNVYVLLEVTALTSYALIAMGSTRRAPMAAYNYVIMGTIGASFYLLGVGYLYAKTGSLNMADIRSIIIGQNLMTSESVRVAFMLILLGLGIKMAFFPVHGWLPNAYANGPSASVCLMAPLVTKVTIYVMIRMMVSVFGLEYAFQSLDWNQILVWAAVIAIVGGSIMALSQTELKRVFCYLIVVEVGYMVGGVWMANRWGMAGAIFHIVSDAFMTLCLFLAAGLILGQVKGLEISSLDRLVKKMPVTMAGFIVGALSMIGIPPTCGFFSKWYLIRGGIESGHWHYVAALLLSSLINAILFFKIIEVAYFGAKPPEGHHHEPSGKPAPRLKAPLPAQFALLTTAAMLILIGLFNAPIIQAIDSWFLKGLPVIGAE